MNLQDTLAAMLEQRRDYVHAGPSEAIQAKLLGTGPGSLVDIFSHSRELLPHEVAEVHENLTMLGGALLFLLHPEDEAVVGTTDPDEEPVSFRGPKVPPPMNSAFHVVACLDERGEPTGLPLPLPAGARVHIVEEGAVWTSDGEGGWSHKVPDTVAIAHAFTGLSPDHFTD